MGLFGNKIIRVVFQVERTGEKLGFSEMKHTQIPESWNFHTDVTIAGKKWEVASVEPEKRKEMIRNRELRVWVRRADDGKDHSVSVAQEQPAEQELPIMHATVIPIEDEEPIIENQESHSSTEEADTEPEQLPEVPELIPIDLVTPPESIESEQEEPSVNAQAELQPEVLVEAPIIAEQVTEEEEAIPVSEPPLFEPDEVALPWPTKVGEFPQVAQTDAAEESFVVHQDMWRQIEWVDANREAEMQDTFRNINQVYEVHCFFRNGHRYFRDLHVRHTWDKPLSRTLTLEELRLDFFPNRIDFSSLVIEPLGRVVHGFAFQLDSGLVFYGTVDGDNVQSLALSGSDNLEYEALSLELDSMVTLMNDYGWVLVDWLDQQRVEANREEIHAFLTT